MCVGMGVWLCVHVCVWLCINCAYVEKCMGVEKSGGEIHTNYLKDNSDSTQASKSKSGKIQMLPDLPNVRMSNAVPKGTT